MSVSCPKTEKDQYPSGIELNLVTSWDIAVHIKVFSSESVLNATVDKERRRFVSGPTYSFSSSWLLSILWFHIPVDHPESLYKPNVRFSPLTLGRHQTSPSFLHWFPLD